MKKLAILKLLGSVVIVTWTLTILTTLTISQKATVRGNSTASPEKPALSNQSNLPNLSSADVIQATIDRIEKLQSISAELEIDTYLFGENYKGVGKYEELIARTEQSSDDSSSNRDDQPGRAGSRRVNARHLSPLEWSRFRLHVKMLPEDAKVHQDEAEESVLEIVCDLKALWTYTKIEGGESLTQLHIEDLANSLSRLTEEERASLALNAVERPCGMSGLPGLGGVSGLLRRFLTLYDFTSAPEETSLDGGRFPVWKISGRLKKDIRERTKNFLLADEPDERRVLLESVPTDLEIFIGKERPFPYRVRYFSKWEEEKLAPQPICSISFNPYYENVSSINPQSFIYGPPPLNYDRINDRYLMDLVPGIEL